MAITNAEATVVAKGVELTHGNSSHYVTFELETGERLFFQVSIKIYMLLVEGDYCSIDYKDSSYGKKKLKSFERIGKNIPVANSNNNANATGLVSSGFAPKPNDSKSGNPFRESHSEFSKAEQKRSFEPVKKLKEASSSRFENDDFDEDLLDREMSGYKPHKLLRKLDSYKNDDSEDL